MLSCIREPQDMNALCLAMLCVANFAAYERKVLADEKGGQKLGKYLPLEDSMHYIIYTVYYLLYTI